MSCCNGFLFNICQGLGVSKVKSLKSLGLVYTVDLCCMITCVTCVCIYTVGVYVVSLYIWMLVCRFI